MQRISSREPLQGYEHGSRFRCAWLSISLLMWSIFLWAPVAGAARIDGALQAYQQGENLFQQGQRAAAIRSFQRAVELAPANRGMRTRLAWLLLEENQPQESLLHFQHLVAADLEDKNTALGLAISHLKVNQPREAEAVLDKTLVYHPDDPVVLKLLGEALLSRQETAERALQVFTRLSQRFPENQEWRRRREEASHLAAQYYYYQALRDLKAGNQNAALQALKDSTRFDAQNVGYRTHYGWMLGESGDWSGASRQFQEVLHKDPGKKDAYQGLAQARLMTGDVAGAREAASEGLNRFPDDPALLTLLGEALAADVNTRAEAVRHFERLTAMEPDNNTAAVRLARLYIELGDLNAAQSILERIIARAPEYAPAQFSLGQLNLWADAYGVAANNFWQVLKQEPDNREARQDLEKCETFLKPQLQVQGGFFDDSESFRSTYMFTGSRVYITPTLRAETGYGYLTYSMGNNPKFGRTLERTAHRHALPLVLYYRPSRQVAVEVGGVFNNYGVWGSTANARAGVFYQLTPQTGLSVAYAYHDIIDYYGPFRGPYGRMLDDFAEFERYRYLTIDPIALWTSNIFGASSTQAIIRRLQAHDFSFWGYQNILSWLTLSLYGNGGPVSDGNNRLYGGATLTCRLLPDPLVKVKYSFFYIDYRRPSASLANLPAGSAPLYWDPSAFKNHTVGLVFEQNWAKRFKLAFETDIVFNVGANSPGFLGLVELV